MMSLQGLRELKRDKVLFIASYAGIPRVWRMAEGLSRRQFEVHVLEWNRKSAFRKSERVYSILVHHMNLRAPYGLNLIFKLPIWWLFTFLFVLMHNFKVVQPQNLDNLLPVITVCRVKGIRVVYDLADFYSDAYIRRPLLASRVARWLERVLIRSVDGLVLVSEGQLTQVHRSNLPKHYTFIYNTLSDDELDSNIPCDTKALRVRSDIVLFYAGILSTDRLELLLNLAKTLESTNNIKLIIAGFGEMEKFASKVFTKMKNIEYLGSLPHDEVIRQTACCDLIVLPYDPRVYNNTIGLPNKFFEALSLLKPMLAQKGTYMAQIIEENKCGIVTNFLDVKKLRKTLKAIDECDPQHLSEMGLRAKQLFVKRYQWSLMEKKLLYLYAQISSSTPSVQDR